MPKSAKEMKKEYGSGGIYRIHREREVGEEQFQREQLIDELETQNPSEERRAELNSRLQDQARRENIGY